MKAIGGQWGRVRSRNTSLRYVDGRRCCLEFGEGMRPRGYGWLDGKALREGLS